MIKVLIVDDHAFIRQTIADLLGQTEDISVVGQCADGDEVLVAALCTEPDVVLMDLAMPRMPGLEATRQLLAALPRTRVIMLTANPDGPSVRQARDLGVAGFLVKGESPDELRQSVRQAAAGGSVWSPEVVAYLAPGLG